MGRIERRGANRGEHGWVFANAELALHCIGNEYVHAGMCGRRVSARWLLNTFIAALAALLELGVCVQRGSNDTGASVTSTHLYTLAAA